MPRRVTIQTFSGPDAVSPDDTFVLAEGEEGQVDDDYYWFRVIRIDDAPDEDSITPLA